MTATVVRWPQVFLTLSYLLFLNASEITTVVVTSQRTAYYLMIFKDKHARRHMICFNEAERFSIACSSYCFYLNFCDSALLCGSFASYKVL